MRSWRAGGTAVIALLALWHPAAAAATSPAPPPAAAAPAPGTSRADAAALYNAGTAALDRGDLGPAVAFLLAAERIDPRAADLRRNLAEARARAAVSRGAEEPSGPTAWIPVTPAEAWWLAAALLAAGALLAALVHLRPGPATRFPRWLRAAAHLSAVAGLILALALTLRAREESIHPLAVVVVTSLPAGPAPDERPRPPYLLGAGETVRLGRARGALVEILVSGTAIGWAERAGVWRVADAPRYTAGLPGS